MWREEKRTFSSIWWTERDTDEVCLNEFALEMMTGGDERGRSGSSSSSGAGAAAAGGPGWSRSSWSAPSRRSSSTATLWRRTSLTTTGTFSLKYIQLMVNWSLTLNMCLNRFLRDQHRKSFIISALIFNIQYKMSISLKFKLRHRHFLIVFDIINIPSTFSSQVNK